jgi:hypothetical protein
MLPEDWIEHRRPDDRELLGWIRPLDGDWVPVDRLGRTLSSPVDWLDAEATLEAHGLRWLSDLWQLALDDGTVARVRLTEVSPDRVVVVEDHLGAVVPDARTWTLPFPAPGTLRPFQGDSHVLDGPTAG